ncbi:ABC transporter substrate-binding protein [Clostridia bacterium]|nr:ABC transporter substrate-binding protein [Clostridia bacterium]
MKKGIILILFLMGIIVMLSSCATQTLSSIATENVVETEIESKKIEEKVFEFTDALGHEIRLSHPKQVIALSKSFAEVWTLAGGELSGASQDVFEESLMDMDGIENVGALHEPNLEKIIALNPDLVILSADIAGHTKVNEVLQTSKITAAYFSVEKFDDYLHMLKICTELNGKEELYREYGEQIQSEIQEMIKKTESKPHPKILLLRASTGKVVVRNSDTMAGEMLKDMGCINIADSEAGLLEQLSLEVILQEDPDFIFVVLMGTSEENARQALQDTLLSHPVWSSLTAVKTGRYITLPKDLFHQKPNHRWAEAYQQLWKILYEEE